MVGPAFMNNSTKERREYARRRRALTNLDAIIPTKRDRKFFDYYIELGNGRQAMDKLRKEEGKLPAKNFVIANRAMRSPGFRKLKREYNRQVAIRTENMLQKYAVSEDRVLEELVKIAFTNITDHTEWNKDGELTTKSSEELSEETKAAIEEVVSYEDEKGTKRIKIKNISKLKALELIGRKLGLFTEKVDHRHQHLAAVKLIIEK